MKYLGVDFGLKRVGLAISEGTLASPLETVSVKGVKDAIQKISQFAKDKGVSKVIVGLPEGRIGQTALGFVNGLKDIGLDIETTDETLSSRKAIRKMIEENIPRGKRRINDAYSAAIILQDYLDNF